MSKERSPHHEFVFKEITVGEGLPSDFLDQLQETSNYAREAILSGGEGSLEPAGITIRYKIVERPELRERLPWLETWYMESAPSLVSQIIGEEVIPTDPKIVDRGVVLNVVRDRYDLHTDTNAYTFLFCVQEATNGGGGFKLHPPGRETVVLDLKKGMGVVFEGGTIPHEVEPVTMLGANDVPRITAVFNFHRKGENQLPPVGMLKATGQK